jgi:hypothetical protein
MSTLALQFFDVTTKQSKKIERALQRQTGEQREPSLFCKLCGHLITTPGERTEMNGQHLHTCRNPAGFEFTFGCFRHAPGCRAIGKASGEHTWFAGYSWQIAVCAGCGEHLGWLFRNDHEFFGLITGKLAAG